MTKRDIPSATQPSMPDARSLPQTSGPAPKVEREERERDERLRSALEWERFEAWCESNDLPSPPVTYDGIALVALYVTYLAATGRNAATTARALLRARDKKD